MPQPPTIPLAIMLFSTVLLAYYFFFSSPTMSTAVAGAAGSGSGRWKEVRKSNVVGFFAQDLEGTDPAGFDWVESGFGLLDEFTVVGEGEEREEGKRKWGRFRRAIDGLNRRAPRNTVYKVLYLGRHGQGFHNVAEAFYGTHLWDCHWSMLDGNGTSVWADAELTNIGITEAQRANIAWKDQIKAGVPLPESYYSSPLKRAASTLEITWGDITLDKHKTPKPIFKEKLRETIGIHTCDRRSSKTEIAKKFPGFIFEKGFVENDPYWTLELREPNDVRDIRLGEALNCIFVHDDSTYISITAHSGAITSMLQVLGHRPFRLQTGGMIPVVARVEFVPEPEPTPTSVSPSYGAPSCTVQ